MKYDLFLNPVYDDWEDWRDGMRDWFGDNKLIKKVTARMKRAYGDHYEKRMRMNRKQKRLLQRRKARLFHLLGQKRPLEDEEVDAFFSG